MLIILITVLPITVLTQNCKKQDHLMAVSFSPQYHKNTFLQIGQRGWVTQPEFANITLNNHNVDKDIIELTDTEVLFTSLTTNQFDIEFKICSFASKTVTCDLLNDSNPFPFNTNISTPETLYKDYITTTDQHDNVNLCYTHTNILTYGGGVKYLNLSCVTLEQSKGSNGKKMFHWKTEYGSNVATLGFLDAGTRLRMKTEKNSNGGIIGQLHFSTSNINCLVQLKMAGLGLRLYYYRAICAPINKKDLSSRIRELGIHYEKPVYYDHRMRQFVLPNSNQLIARNTDQIEWTSYSTELKQVGKFVSQKRNEMVVNNEKKIHTINGTKYIVDYHYNSQYTQYSLLVLGSKEETESKRIAMNNYDGWHNFTLFSIIEEHSCDYAGASVSNNSIIYLVVLICCILIASGLLGFQIKMSRTFYNRTSQFPWFKLRRVGTQSGSKPNHLEFSTTMSTNHRSDHNQTNDKLNAHEYHKSDENAHETEKNTKPATVPTTSATSSFVFPVRFNSKDNYGRYSTTNGELTERLNKRSVSKRSVYG